MKSASSYLFCCVILLIIISTLADITCQKACTRDKGASCFKPIRGPCECECVEGTDHCAQWRRTPRCNPMPTLCQTGPAICECQCATKSCADVRLTCPSGQKLTCLRISGEVQTHCLGSNDNCGHFWINHCPANKTLGCNGDNSCDCNCS
uniref:Putative metastriate ixostatin family member n=1 Tax=Rhipicephalus pulchellus TaxID=72859 RepID=L7M8W4_RHIPC